MTNENIDLNRQYELFMTKLGIDLTKLSADKKESSKRLFFGGLTGLLDIVSKEIPAMASSLERLEAIKSINDQIDNFWKAEQSINDVRSQLLNHRGAKLYKVGDEG